MNPEPPLSPEELYLDLLKRCLTRALFPEGGAAAAIDHPEVRPERWPPHAETMIGRYGLANIQHCAAEVLRSGVAGDFIETGVWRGGAAIFMRGILKAYRVTDRVIWAADSFQGLPKPDPAQYPADADDVHWTKTELSVSLEEVRANFARYGLLDGQVRFLVGWFRETLPVAPIEKLALMRLDGDMYESTTVALHALYPRLSPGGFVIVDDFGAVPACRQAVEDFRSAQGISEPIERVDWTRVFWRRL